VANLVREIRGCVRSTSGQIRGVTRPKAIGGRLCACREGAGATCVAQAAGGPAAVERPAGASDGAVIQAQLADCLGDLDSAEPLSGGLQATRSNARAPLAILPLLDCARGATGTLAALAWSAVPQAGGGADRPTGQGTNAVAECGSLNAGVAARAAIASPPVDVASPGSNPASRTGSLSRPQGHFLLRCAANAAPAGDAVLCVNATTAAPGAQRW
jgi:hypothetical protein